MEVWLDLLRKKTGGEKIRTTLDLSHFAMQMSRDGVRSRYPHATGREVFLRAAALHLSRDLMIRAYNWDPEEHEEPSGRV